MSPTCLLAVLPSSRDPAAVDLRGSAGMWSVLINTMRHKTRESEEPHADSRLPPVPVDGVVPGRGREPQLLGGTDTQAPTRRHRHSASLRTASLTIHGTRRKGLRVFFTRTFRDLIPQSKTKRLGGRAVRKSARPESVPSSEGTSVNVLERPRRTSAVTTDFPALIGAGGVEIITSTVRTRFCPGFRLRVRTGPLQVGPPVRSAPTRGPRIHICSGLSDSCDAPQRRSCSARDLKHK
ncbi:unnamed protein product [Pleuronectes platessa]|uniref:Uncharacterized protein n=1 Tax=Pleuronectes platessa TaxID=8262 RepID=A0A9N7YHF1_PLEPL|nr:unnamed protein product [Pleuronectes platessa]